MAREIEPHDVFISYAREDSDWVREHLYNPLLKCRTHTGRPPRIFFDVEDDGVGIGQDFQHAIAQAIEKTVKFVPVYSDVYFDKEMCLREIGLAQTRDPLFRHGFLLPVLVEQSAIERIPFEFKTLNFLNVLTSGDWFQRLCQELDLTPSNEELTISFREQPGDVFANHTLPVIRIEVYSGGAPICYDEEITIHTSAGQLLGTTTVRTREGVASFEDLSITDATNDMCLIATSPSAGEVASRHFSVVAQCSEEIKRDLAIQESGHVSVPTTGDVIFFATGEHFAVVQPNQIMAYSVSGQPIIAQPLPLDGPLRVVRRQADMLVLADWRGSVLQVRTDGRQGHWQFRQSPYGFVVPADIDISPEGEVYVAFWSGSVFQLKDSGEASLVLRDKAGVQATAVYEDDLYTCDFEGNLHVYRNGRLLNTVMIEPTVWLLLGGPSCLVGVGDQKFYHISSTGSRVIDFEMPLAEVQSIYELSDLPIVVDTNGKSIRFDANLVISAEVYTQPGAEPVSADHGGKYCVFRNPDGARTLMIRDRIVFCHSQGTLSVSPLGNLFAVGDAESIRLLSEEAFLDYIQREEVEIRPVVRQGGEA